MLIVALDVFTFEEAKRIVEATRSEVSIYKVGLQLLTSEGPKVIHYLRDQGKDVFLDLKLHEIPNSVASAVKAAGAHGVSMLTVHASGGKNMMEAAVRAASVFPNLKILALTVVTGLTSDDLKEIGFSLESENLVLRLAKLAESSGCHGVVASSQEAKLIKDNLHSEFLIVTPGIRPNGIEAYDQSRIGTPSFALKNGATHIIVGRPVVQAQDPESAAKAINLELQSALKA
ncbi:MAG: orotidine-5'-phosphate decarboxylase [Natronospirillum sp.]